MYTFVNPVMWYFVLQAYFRWRYFISILLHYMKSFMTSCQPFRQHDMQEGGWSIGHIFYITWQISNDLTSTFQTAWCARWLIHWMLLLHYMTNVHWLDVNPSDSMMCKKVADPLDASFTLHDKFLMTWHQPFRQHDVQEGGWSIGCSTTCGGHIHSAEAVPQREHQLLPGLPGPVCPVHHRHHGQVGACLLWTWLRCVCLVLLGQLKE